MADEKAMLKEFQRRFKSAEQMKQRIWPEVKEVYFFCMEGSADGAHIDCDKHNLFTGTPSEAAEDFAADLATYFIPEYAEWINFVAGQEIDPDFEYEAGEQIEQIKSAVMNEIAASNLYATAASSFLDFAHGTAAFWQHDVSLSQPVGFEMVHASELFINVDLFGALNDRFRRRTVTWDYLFDEYPQLKEVKRFAGYLKDSENKTGTLTHGFWMDNEDRGSGRWKERVVVNDELVDYGDLDDIAEVPLLVGRFRPGPKRAWGYGPGRRLLPAMRTLNEMAQMSLDNMDKSLDPAFAAVGANSMQNDFSGGLVGGEVYEIPIGGGLEKIDIAGDLNLGMLTVDQYEEQIRRGFFQDGPRQKGLTPPSATQWLDEARRIQKRMGRPAAPIFTEMIIHLIKRTAHILARRGRLEKGIKFDGKTVTLQPINPLTYAQRQEEVVIARSLLNDIFTFDPANAGVTVDVSSTFREMKLALGDRLVKVRSRDEAAAEQQRLAQIQAAQAGGAV